MSFDRLAASPGPPASSDLCVLMYSKKLVEGVFIYLFIFRTMQYKLLNR